MYQVLFGPPGIFHQKKRRRSDCKQERGRLKGQNIHHARGMGKQRKKNQSGQGRKGICLRLSCFSCYPNRALKELTQNLECRHEGSSSYGARNTKKNTHPKPLLSVAADTIAWAMLTFPKCHSRRRHRLETK